MNINTHNKSSKIDKYIVKIDKIIDNASTEIEKEFSTTDNDRVACLRSIVNQVSGNYQLFELVEGNPNDKMKSKIESIKKETERLHTIYIGNKSQPSEKEKEKVLNNLLEIKELINMIKISES